MIPGEWVVTRTPEDPSLDPLWLGRARDALHAFDQYAEQEGFGPYSELIDPRPPLLISVEEAMGLVCQTSDGLPWAIMTNFSVTAILVRSGEEIEADYMYAKWAAPDCAAHSIAEGYSLGDPKVQTLWNQEPGGIR